MRHAIWLFGVVSLAACTDSGKSDAPTCSITAPEDGGSAREGGAVKFEGTASGEGSVTIVLSSDLDGDLGAALTGGGAWGLSTVALSVGTHQISLDVSDAAGSCSAEMLFTVGNPPTVFITDPYLDDVIGNAAPVEFSASVSDDVDAPGDIAIAWEHDGTGLFGEDAADADGVATAELSDLAVGAHSVTVTATDTSGFYASNTITFTIDAAPTTPEVQILPASPTSSEGLVGEILTDSVDPDGGKVTYRYAWLVDGEETSHFVPEIASKLTARDEVWTLQVYPSDGVVEGVPGEAEVTIANSPPSPPSVSIAPEGPTDEDALVCTVDKPSLDEDGDPVSYSVTWTLNETSHTGATETTTIAGDTIPITELVDGDTWLCIVEADDTFDTSLPAISEPVTISPSIVIYDIDSTMLNSLPNDCSSTGNAPYSSCSGGWGFSWTSTGARTPSSMTVTLRIGVWCSSSSPSIQLNGSTLDTISPTVDCNCSPSGSTVTVKTTSMSSYVDGGSNSITITGGNSCEGLVADGTLGTDIYASVEVDY